MKYRLLLLLAALPSSLYSQTSKLEKWNTIDRMCGRVILVEKTITPLSSHTTERPLKKAEVLLYHRKGNKKCCTPEELVSETSTESGGGFELKDAGSGQYWVVVAIDKKRYRLAVTVGPSERKGDVDCSDLLYEVVKDGDMQLVRKTTYHLS
jgi:hypothetical protein